MTTTLSNDLPIALSNGFGAGSPSAAEKAWVRPAIRLLQGEFATEVVALPATALHCCAIDIGAYEEACWSALSIERPPRLHRAVRKRCADFLAGRHCAGRALAAIGITGHGVGSNDDGSPLWPVGVQGSISHNDAIAVAVVTAAPGVRGLGVDVQSTVSAAVIDEIAALILHGSDAAQIARYPQQSALAFTLIFSIKESFFKAAFPTLRRYFDFSVAEIEELDWADGSFRLRLLEDLDQDQLRKGCIFGGRFIIDGQRVITLLAIGG